MFLFNHRIVKFLKESVPLKGRFGNCLYPIGMTRSKISNRPHRLQYHIKRIIPSAFLDPFVL